MRWFYLIGCITLLLCYRRGCFLWVSTYLGASNKKIGLLYRLFIKYEKNLSRSFTTSA